jgi:hypothetical protein
MSNYIVNTEMARSELSYRRELAVGRESTWARTEGRRGTLLRRWRKNADTEAIAS